MRIGVDVKMPIETVMRNGVKRRKVGAIKVMVLCGFRFTVCFAHFLLTPCLIVLAEQLSLVLDYQGSLNTKLNAILLKSIVYGPKTYGRGQYSLLSK